MKKIIIAFLIAILFAGISEGAQTKITVRARSKDAKFIGSSMGGALVVIKDAETGEVLARGITSGGTGNTRKIMVEPLRRGVPICDTDTAKFEATIDLAEPKLVNIEVSAPYGQRQSVARNTAQLWLIPGKDITGDGIIIDVYGFSVSMLAPQLHENIKLAGGRAKVPIRASIVMMCGCPITANGLWDANKYEVKAIVKLNGGTSEEIPLLYANKANTFEGTLEATKEGIYEATVYAFDPATANAGVDKIFFMVTQ